MLKYTVVKQKIAMSSNKEVCYYPRLTKRREVGLEELADMVRNYSTYSRGDFMGLIALLEDLIPDLLMDGCNVKLGKIGTFQLHAHTKSAQTEEEVTWRNFLSVKPRCIPKFDIRLSQVNFQRVK